MRSASALKDALPPGALQLEESGAWLARCSNVEEVERFLRKCTEHGAHPRVRSGRGALPLSGGALSLEGLDQIESIDVASGVVTAQVGVTVGQLRQALSDSRQLLPCVIDSPDEEALGDVIAGGQVGGLASAYGPMSAFVLGGTFVLRRGDTIHLGTQARKDVTGYDILRWNISNGDSNCVMTSVTCKVIADPACWKHVVIPCADLAEARDLAVSIVKDVHPIGVLCADSLDDEGAVIAVRLCGSPGAVEEQAHGITASVREVLDEARGTATGDALWKRFDDRGCRAEGGTRAVVPLGVLDEFCGGDAPVNNRIVCPLDGRISWFSATDEETEAMTARITRVGGTVFGRVVQQIPEAIATRLRVALCEGA